MTPAPQVLLDPPQMHQQTQEYVPTTLTFQRQEQQQKGIPRRAQWQPKAKIVAEYWVLGAAPGEWQGVTVADVNDPGELMQDLMTWADVLELSSHMAVGVDQGLPAAQAAAAATVA